jgi:membrane protease subunit (stomatin/prohibitin family)
LLSKLDNKWGTPNPIQLEDPKYGIVVPVRSYGQFGFKISDPKTFLESLVGTIKIYSAEKIVEYFTGKLLASLSSIITKKIVFDNISILQISAFLEDLSKFCELSIQSEFNKFGIEIVNFFIISINIPENDPSVIKLKEIKEKSMYINTVGKDVYSFDRSMDVMETAAGNEGNIGNLMGAGIGLGMGLGIGGTMGDKMGSIGNQLNTNLNQSNQICSNCNSQNPSASKFCGVCGKELKPNAEPIKSIICDKCGKTSPLGSKFCQHCGDVFFLCLHCGTDNPENVKFCINCGKPMINVCPNCNKELTSSSKFCGNCGHKLF